MFNRIPPVGNPIATAPSLEPISFPGALKTYLLQSGTAALATALGIAKEFCQASKPEVIIPAYCCPDLLSAILYHDMQPVLVDFVTNQPYMDLNQIEASLTENTVAVIAVNFLGIPERFDEIKALLKNHKTLLIEDSAQWYPENELAFTQHKGDLITYSFGKGKPVSILGGGATLVANPELLAHTPSNIPTIEDLSHAVDNKIKNLIMYSIYNQVISPYVYWLLELAPFIHLGNTVFHPLTNITQIDRQKLLFLKANISAYSKRENNAVAAWNKKISASIHTLPFKTLNSTCVTYQQQRLLRLPLLFENSHARNHFLKAIGQQGLGISALYQEPLTKIKSIPSGVLPSRGFKHAEDFSKKLLTLPTHDHVSESHISKVFSYLS